MKFNFSFSIFDDWSGVMYILTDEKEIKLIEIFYLES